MYYNEGIELFSINNFFLAMIALITIALSLISFYFYFSRKRLFLYLNQIELKGLMFGKYICRIIPYDQIRIIRINEKGRRIQIRMISRKIIRVNSIHYKDLENIISKFKEKELKMVFEPFYPF